MTANDISLLGSLFKEGVLAHDAFDTKGDQRIEEFSGGRISMIIGSTRDIPLLRERMGDGVFGISTIPLPSVSAPSNSARKYNISLSGIYAGLDSRCEYPEEAWRFIEFLKGQTQLFFDTFKPVFGVASWDLIPDEKITSDPFYSKARDIFESSEVVKGFSGDPDAQKYENAFLEELQIFINGAKTAQEAANAVQYKWEQLNTLR
jgi:ABC-type glycerol-3-phosphate transport system substrate-binding protein